MRPVVELRKILTILQEVHRRLGIVFHSSIQDRNAEHRRFGALLLFCQDCDLPVPLLATV
jgi:hypothetical protein